MAFILSLLPFLARYRFPVGRRGFLFCVTAQDNSHGGFFVFVTALPHPVRYLVRGRAIYFALPTSLCYLFTLHYYLFPKTVGEALEPPVTRCDFVGRYGRMWASARTNEFGFACGIRRDNGFFDSLRSLRMTGSVGQPILFLSF